MKKKEKEDSPKQCLECSEWITLGWIIFFIGLLNFFALYLDHLELKSFSAAEGVDQSQER